MMELLKTMRVPQRIRLTKKMWQDETASKCKASLHDGAASNKELASQDEAVSSKDEAVSSKDGDASHNGTA